MNRERITCAVSGGADSVALLALAIASGAEVSVVHVDHGLRPESGAEAAAVEALCRHWGVPCRVERVRVDQGADLEQRARRARHAVLPPDTAFGHTLDDQAETLLIRLLRGTGPAGLAEMDRRSHPLLGLRRADTVAVCDHLGVTPIHDSSNSEGRFVRNRVRAEVLPLLDDVAGRDVAPLLARLALLAAQQRDWVDACAEELDVTDAASFADAPAPLAAAALGRWWREVTGADHPPDHAAFERVRAVARAEAPGADVAAGWSLRRTAGRLRLERAVTPRAHPPSTSGSGSVRAVGDRSEGE